MEDQVCRGLKGNQVSKVPAKFPVASRKVKTRINKVMIGWKLARQE